MAVYKIKDSEPVEILLGAEGHEQPVVVNVRKGNFTVGDMETMQDLTEDFPRLQKRLDFLSKQADLAIEGSDEEFDRATERLREFRKGVKIFDMIDNFLSAIVESADLYLTEEDKTNNRPVLFDRESLKSVRNDLKFELFTKLTAKLGAGDEKEKKELSESLQSDSQTPTSESAPSPHSTTFTLSQENMV